MSIYKVFPSFKNYLWGGNRLVKEFNKNYDPNEILAESWELSCHEQGPSYIIYNNSKISLSEYIKLKGKEILGQNCKIFNDFPILIKLIDAKKDLSIQVHPDDQYALENEHEYGKTEVWYILDAQDGAFIYYGFKDYYSKEQVAKAIKNSTITEYLKKIYVKKGDVFFIKAGTVHAIGAGIVIAEIQQNSNLTYRIFDYDRVDNSGKKRELHIDKSIKVMNISPAENYCSGEHIAKCKYFCTDKLDIESRFEFNVDQSSFVNLLITNGSCTIYNNSDVINAKKGDSIFIDANSKQVIIEGNATILKTYVPTFNFKVGIDIGGTDCKIGILSEDNNFIDKCKISTSSASTPHNLVVNICKEINQLLDKHKLSMQDCLLVGLGVPGLHDTQNGIVLYSNNLQWKMFNIVQEFKRQLDYTNIIIANDADCAALGESILGAAKNYKDVLMITLGTGIGTGVIHDHKIFSGFGVGTCEFGHTIIVPNGKLCTCGRFGCFEAYASASALIKEAIAICGNSNITAKDIFDLADSGDKKYQTIINEYINYLAIGIVNAINAYNPQIVIIGGGISAQQDKLLNPIREYAKINCFGGNIKPLPKFVIATLGNDAGIVGAANLK